MRDKTAKQPNIYKARKVNVVMKKNMYFVFFMIIAFFGLLVGRLVYLNQTNGEQYEKAVLQQQSYSSRTISAQRGRILDRNGIVLAKNTTKYNVVIDPKVILSKDYYYEPTIKTICKVFGYDREELEKTISEKSTRSYVVYEKDIPYTKVMAFNQAKSTTKHVVGVWFEEIYTRIYPYGKLASHVLGYVQNDGTGTNGLEQYYDSSLKGTDGLAYGYFDSELNIQNTIKDATDGCDLISTIDKNIQEVVEKKVSSFIETTGCKDIGVIVMDPNNGEILSMSSNLEYDLNNPRTIVGVSSEEFNNLSDEDKMNMLYKQWRNFCVSDSYEPGSTFKTITVASALEENAVEKDQHFYCEGFKEVGGWTINCNNKDGHEDISLTQALMKSCNCALMDVAEKLGPDRFFYYQKLFGFGARTGIDLTAEATGIIIPRKNLNVTELATSSFGTTFNVTMVQMASAYASIINGGAYYTPHLVKKILNSDGTEAVKDNCDPVRQTVSASTSDFIKEALYLTVEAGTATPAKVSGYVVAGKTGTAQKRPREEKKYVVSFCGFAPVQNPKVMIYLVIDEVEDPQYTGSSKPATIMFSQIMEEILPYLGIYPEGRIAYHIDEELLESLRAEMKEEELNPDVLPAGLDGIIE